jgi:hypothetical protein
VAEETNRIEVLEAEIKSMMDTQKNLVGLVQKLVLIQANLSEAGFQAFSDSLSDPFSTLSTAAEKLEGLIKDVEIERNRLRSEAK